MNFFGFDYGFDDTEDDDDMDFDEYDDQFSSGEFSSEISETSLSQKAIAESSLCQAVIKNDLEGLKELLSKGEDPNIANYTGTSLLHIAIKNDLHIMFDYLMSLENIDFDVEDDDGCTPLVKSICALDSKHFVEALLEKGAEVNVTNYQGLTALHKALNCGKVDLCEMLIEKGADVNAGQSSLHHALRGKSSNCVNLLIYHNVVVDWDNWNDLYLEAMKYSEVEKDDTIMNYICDDVKTSSVDLDLINSLIMYSHLPKILKVLINADEIDYDKQDLVRFGQYFSLMPIDCLEIMLEKFEYVINDFVSNCDVLNIIFHELERAAEDDGNYVSVTHLYLLINKGFAPQLIESYRLITPVLNLLFDLPLDLLTEILTCLMSYGFQVTIVDVFTLYDYHGYCELFKLILYVDYDENFKVSNLRLQEQGSSIMAALLCDMNMSIDKFVHLMYIDVYDDQFYDFLRHCAHPRIRKLAAESDLANLIQREQRLPRVPSLLELARNESRQHIIDFYQIKKCSKYYTILKHMGLSVVCVKLLSFQKCLYPDDNNKSASIRDLLY